MVEYTYNNIELSRREYFSLPDADWLKLHFFEKTGGYLVTHVLKEKDNLHRSGIVAEVKACFTLASIGKHILRLPENKPELIDTISISGKAYRTLLKFKVGDAFPRGYPDVYFDNQTWDFKTSTYRNVDTIRQLIKDGRKADNVIFIISEQKQIRVILSALYREMGNRRRDNSWINLPDLYSLMGNKLEVIWKK